MTERPNVPALRGTGPVCGHAQDHAEPLPSVQGDISARTDTVLAASNVPLPAEMGVRHLSEFTSLKGVSSLA